MHRVLPVPEHLPRRSGTTRTTSRPSPGPASSSATPSWTCTPTTALDRKEFVQEHGGLGLCNITKCCTEVCPESIKITDNGIIPMKERVVDVKYDPVRFLRSRRRRKAKQP